KKPVNAALAMPMIEVSWSKSMAPLPRWPAAAGRRSASQHQKAHATSSGVRTFGAQRGGLKYLVNLVLPRGPWIRTNVGGADARRALHLRATGQIVTDIAGPVSRLRVLSTSSTADPTNSTIRPQYQDGSSTPVAS